MTNSAGLSDQELEGMRTSKGTFVARQQDMRISCIESRIALWVQQPVTEGESMNILHYEVGKEYKAHHDYFDPAIERNQEILSRGGQRVGTVLMYLSDVEQGGETTFPRLKLGVCPKQGTALYFRNCSVGEELDKDSLHASRPVKVGDKWTATKWLRAREVTGPE